MKKAKRSNGFTEGAGVYSKTAVSADSDANKSLASLGKAGGAMLTNLTQDLPKRLKVKQISAAD